jgi:ATP-dependent Lon protease
LIAAQTRGLRLDGASTSIIHPTSPVECGEKALSSEARMQHTQTSPPQSCQKGNAKVSDALALSAAQKPNSSTAEIRRLQDEITALQRKFNEKQLENSSFIMSFRARLQAGFKSRSCTEDKQAQKVVQYVQQARRRNLKKKVLEILANRTLIARRTIHGRIRTRMMRQEVSSFFNF